MLRIAMFIPLFAIGLYLAAMLLVWGFQRSLIYPAPQNVVAVADGYQEATLNTSDGLSIRAFYREADAAKPTLVYFHGNGGTLQGSMAANAIFAREGYGLLLVNYRGYGGNPGSPSEDGFYNDGRAAMAFLAAQGVLTADTILIGNSIGSGTATQMASEFTPKALILSAPFTSVPDVAAQSMSWLPVRMLAKDRFDNAAKIGVLELPILVQHGLADDLIPSQHGETLAELAQNAELQLFDGIGHDLTFMPQAQTARLAWIEALK